MKKANLFIVFVLLLSACGPASVSGTISTCHATLDAMSALTGGLEFPANFQTENPVKTGGEFDVMQYFSALNHLSMQSGYLLDYVYHYDGMGGYPVLYVRPAGQTPYVTEADLAAGGDRTSYLDYIQSDDTPESYFQFVVLATMGSQFYLFWHANYGDSQIVCDKTGVSDIVASLNGDFGYRISLVSRVRAALLKVVGPSVNIGKQTVEVRFVTFTRWGGFYQETYILNRSMPHTIQDVQEKTLVPYECGVIVMHQDQMLLLRYRCIKTKCYREIFQSLATFSSIVVLSWTGLSWTYKLVKRALVSNGMSFAASTRW